MEKIVVKDGVIYLSYSYKDEGELENLVREHSEYIFGNNSLFFRKNEIKSKAGIRTIPDGFVLLPSKRKWYIVEIERATHPLFDHIVTQISKFYNAIKNHNTKKKLIDAFYDEIDRNSNLLCIYETLGIKEERYKLLTDIINKNPEIVIVIDKKTKELEDVCNTLPSVPQSIEFKTYQRENSNILLHIFDTLVSYPLGNKKELKTTLKEAKEITIYTKERHPKNIPDEIKELYKTFESKILEMGKDITIKSTKWYIGFIARTNFVDIRIQQKSLKIWLNLKKGELKDLQGIARDVSNTGHWGNGDYQIQISNDSNLEYIMDLIKQSYERHRR